ncbi:MAG: o-succinylbenzoate synthase [Bacteroidales bacterium]|nr:o-succinylbenzoate synthase [Bacteroidales bacterium]
MYSLNFIPYTLHFKKPAGTSRGVYTTRKVWYALLTDQENPEHFGVGECAPLPNLSCDDVPGYEAFLAEQSKRIADGGRFFDKSLTDFPSVMFGMETAFLHYNAGSVCLFDNHFTRQNVGIPINGLIWMSSKEDMLEQIKRKLSAGFKCIKLKIGAIDFDEELSLIKYIRQEYSPADIEIRVDANGAFSADTALEKLKRLSDFSLHSIEQPIRAGQWEQMAALCAETPLPIAFDEELIGANTLDERIKLLDSLKPQYIVLKPSLHGGMRGSQEWIDEARKRQIGWWITSALESNVGLNAIAQFCAAQNPQMPQGLGTGMLFTDNIDFPLEIRKDKLWFTGKTDVDFSKIMDNG